MEVERWSSAAPGLIPPEAPAIQLGLDVFERVVGARPLLIRVGGTLPIVPALAERGRARAAAFFDRLDARLAESPFVALDRFTYADIVGFVNWEFAVRSLRADPTEGRANLARWRAAVAARPAIAAAG